MKTIIVPLDFSYESLNGLNLSMMLADITGADIQMVHVIAEQDGTNNERMENAHQLATMKFEEILLKCKEKSDLNFDLNYVIKEGVVFKQITNLADEYDDVLIVLATREKPLYEELFIGSYAYNIISHSKNPVITIRKNKMALNIDKIVLPLDVTFKTREKVSYSVKLEKLNNSSILMLSVRLINLDGIEENLHQYIEQVVSHIVNQNTPYKFEQLQSGLLTDIIIEYSRSADAERVLIMTEQEKFVSDLLLGSYAHQMINKALSPVFHFQIINGA